MGKHSNIKAQKSIFQIQYFPELQFFDRVAALSSNEEHFFSWERDFNHMLFKDYDSKDLLVVKVDSATYQTIDRKTDRESTIISYMQEVVKLLSKTKYVTRLGTRTFYSIDTQIPWSQLNEILALKLVEKELFESLGIVESFTAVNIIFKKESYRFRVEILNIGQKELVSHMNIGAQDFFKQGNEGIKDYFSHLEKIPEHTTMIDIDISSNKEINDFGEIEEFYIETNKLKTDFIQKLNNYLFKVKL